MNRANTEFVVGGVIEKDGKYLLVQEAKKSCYGEWNLPAGHLEIGETILEAAKREIWEETGCEVELKGICQIGSRASKSQSIVWTTFVAQLVAETIHITDPAETLDIKWWSYDEILVLRDAGKIRNPSYVLGSIDAYRQGIIASLDLVKIYPRKD